MHQRAGRQLQTRLQHWKPEFLNAFFDPGNRYSVPYAYTVTLLGYNVEKLQALGLPTEVPDAEFGDQLDQPGVVTMVTGWGLVEGGGHPEALHETEIQMMDRDLCNQSLLAARAEAAAEVPELPA